MSEAAMLATSDAAGALAMLRAMPHVDGAFIRGRRFVELAVAQQARLGYRSDNVETWLRWGFRTLARWAVANGVR